MKTLFTKTQLGPLNLKNRIGMAPLTRQRADQQGVVKPFVADYYGQRATAGLIIAEGTQPSFEGQGYCRTPGIHTPEQVAAWKKVTDRVHHQGSHMFLQIMHVGRIAHPLNRVVDSAPVAPSAVKPAGQIWTDQKQMQDFPMPRALLTPEVKALVQEFTRAAELAIQAGFDGVELHAANGYLLNQFLSSNTNQRTDQYGGSVKNRIRLICEIVDSVGSAIGLNRTGIRVSPGHMFNDLVDANPIETHTALIQALPSEKMAYVHLMLPDAFSPKLNNAGPTGELVQKIRAVTKGALLAAGNLNLDSAEAAVQSGLYQVAVFGRPFIANPDLLARWQNGWPLAQPKEQFFYTPDAEGYSDYPAYKA